MPRCRPSSAVLQPRCSASRSSRRAKIGGVPAPLFELEQVSVAGSDGAWRLRDVTTTISDDGITALVGPSGSGKSTMLRCLNRLEVPAAGTIRYRGRDTATMDPLELRRQVGMVFQRPTPFPGSCRDNLRTARADLTETEATKLLERVRL